MVAESGRVPVTTEARKAPGAGGLLLVGLIALVAVVVATFVLGNLVQRSTDSVLAARTLSDTADRLRYAVRSAEASQRGYVFAGNQIYLAPYSTSTAEARRRIAELEAALAGAPDTGPALARLSALVDEILAEMDRIIALKREGRDAEAAEMVQTNRGKALMDEANVFLARFGRLADARLTAASEEQRKWLSLLRAINVAAAALILVVVAAVVWTIWNFARGLERARNEVEALNADLERRVEERTAELAAARDRAELLMGEVNHRVANSLALVASMVQMQARSAGSEEIRRVLSEVHARVFAVSMVHRGLYVSGDVRSVDLAEFLGTLLEQLAAMMKDTGHGSMLRHEIAPLSVSTDKSVSLGVIATELVTNAFKYAYPAGSGEIRARLEQEADTAVLTVEDDGIGRVNGTGPQGTGLGSRLVSAMAASLGGGIEYLDRRPGTVARVSFPI